MMIVNRIKYFTIVFFTIFILSGCQETESTDGDDTLENQNTTIAYNTLSFHKTGYHISKTISGIDVTFFFCDLDKDMDSNTEESLYYAISTCDRLLLNDYGNMKEYFDTTMTYTELSYYQMMESEKQIQSIYKADNLETAEYMIQFYGEDKCYRVISNDKHLEYTLLGGFPDEYLVYRYTKEIIGEDNITERRLNVEYFYSEKRAAYEWTGNQTINHIEFQIKQGDAEYECFLSYFGEQDQLRQTLVWKKSDGIERYPQLLDVNADGYLDIYAVDAVGTSYDSHILFLWNEESKQFQKVEYDECLAEISIENGYLKNWIRSGEGYIYQILRFEGNQLVKESEEIVMPEE